MRTSGGRPSAGNSALPPSSPTEQRPPAPRGPRWGRPPGGHPQVTALTVPSARVAAPGAAVGTAALRGHTEEPCCRWYPAGGAGGQPRPACPGGSGEGGSALLPGSHCPAGSGRACSCGDFPRASSAHEAGSGRRVLITRCCFPVEVGKEASLPQLLPCVPVRCWRPLWLQIRFPEGLS